MANGGPNNPKQDWVTKEGFEIDSNTITIEQVQKVAEKGYVIEHDADTGKTTVPERVIIKGDRE